MVIHLVRHGRTSWNQERRLQGWKGAPLSAEGEEEARKFADKLVGLSLNAIYSSDLERAIQTARIISERVNPRLQLIVDERLREINHGEWEGMPVREIAGLSNMPTVEGFRPPGGESFGDVANRVSSFLRDLRASGQQEVLIVGHQVANAVLWLLAEGFEPGHRVFGFLSAGMVASLGLLASTGSGLCNIIQLNTECARITLGE